MTFAAAIARIGAEIDLGNLTPFEVSELLDRQRILKALEKYQWNQLAAAEALGMHRSTLARRMEALVIEKPDDAAPIKYRRPGKPITPKGEMAKTFDIRRPDRMSAAGLDRPMSELALRARLSDRKHYAEKKV